MCPSSKYTQPTISGYASMNCVRSMSAVFQDAEGVGSVSSGAVAGVVASEPASFCSSETLAFATFCSVVIAALSLPVCSSEVQESAPFVASPTVATTSCSVTAGSFSSEAIVVCNAFLPDSVATCRAELLPSQFLQFSYL